MTDADQRDDAHLRYLLQQMPGFVGVLKGPDHVYQYVNDAFLTIAGERNYVGRAVRDVFPELAGQGYFELLDQVYASGIPFTAKSMPLKLSGRDETRYIDLLYQPIRDDRGAITGIFIGGYDTTTHVHAAIHRDALVKLTDRISNLSEVEPIEFAAAQVLGEALNVSRVGYGTIDPVAETLHVVRDWNAPGVETLAGTLPLRAYGSFIDSLKRGEFISINDVDHDERTSPAAEALKARSAHSFVNVPVTERGQLVAVLYVNHATAREWSVEDLAFIREVAARTRVAVERRRNEIRLRELNATLQERIAAALRDQAMMEQALRQSQKMEAVGQLTGGLAHDFNNLLAGISGSLEVIRTCIDRGRLSEVDKFLSAAQASSRRAAALTHRLLAFSRRQTLEPKAVDIRDVVTDMIDLIGRTVGPSIEIKSLFDDPLWPARVDISQLENALLNLCINARDAMPDGGLITIEARNQPIDAKVARTFELPPGDYVSLQVSDSGTGMTPEVLAKAFDPFFTTKPLGEGTGLGLSMIYGFAQQSGGSVRISSAVSKGTQVLIHLPRSAQRAKVEDVEESPLSGSDSGGETVLIVDDEPTVRMLVKHVLDEFGYKTIEADTGAAGLKLVQAGKRIDLLVTDVGLPGGMNGRQLADAAHALVPDLKVLFITGYAETSMIKEGELERGMAVLTKPFTVETLLSRVREMLVH